MEETQSCEGYRKIVIDLGVFACTKRSIDTSAVPTFNILQFLVVYR